MQRHFWGSKIGFIFAAASSAIGLANIWRFPYIVGKYGGASFIAVYLICLLLIGFPVFIAEILIGRTTHKSPTGAFETLGGNQLWRKCGLMTVITGFLISSFYSVVAGWVLGYLMAALSGQLTHFTNFTQTQNYFIHLVSNPIWTIGFHAAFMIICTVLLMAGIRKGIEAFSRLCMPLLLVILAVLIFKGLSLPQGSMGLAFLLKPDWTLLTPTAILIALGHSFFTLSLGQGTMVTYGSYLPKTEDIPFSCLWVALMDTLVALLASFAIFTLVFAAGLEPESGPGLVFYVLPKVFSQLPSGNILASLFFLLLILAAITSQISALEPTIAFLVEEKKMSRKRAVAITTISSFVIGIFTALSSGIYNAFTIGGYSFFEIISFIALDVFVPIGGFLAVILVAWKWGIKNAFEQIALGGSTYFNTQPFIKRYLTVTMRLSAPILIICVFLHAMKVL